MPSNAYQLFIDGSAKHHFIGAGLIIVSPHQESPLRYSYHMRLTQLATSTHAEFFALRKALEWIQEHKPDADISIITDSHEVASKTPRQRIPQDVLNLLVQLHSSFNHAIEIQQAEPQHQRLINLAHRSSRDYMSLMSRDKTLTPNQSLTSRSSIAWLCLQQHHSTWIAKHKESDQAFCHPDPIQALYQLVQSFLMKEERVIPYFDLTATQIIHYHTTHYPTREARHLLHCLQRRQLVPMRDHSACERS